MLKEMFAFDRSRQTRRREIRGKLAEIACRRRRVNELAAEIRTLDDRADRAANVHAGVCAPLQERLSAVESRLRDAITDRKPTSEKDERIRRELIEAVGEANETLERETALIASLRKPLAKERHELQGQNSNETVLENELCNEQLGEPGLLDEAWIVRQQAEWLHARQRNADQQLAKFESHLRELREHDTKTRGRMGYGPQIELAEKKARRWRREVEAAREQLRQANAAGEAIRQKLLDE